jgi:hypothetical protein
MWTFCGRAGVNVRGAAGVRGEDATAAGDLSRPPLRGLNQLPTTKQTLVVPLPPMFSVATRLAFSTW